MVQLAASFVIYLALHHEAQFRSSGMHCTVYVYIYTRIVVTCTYITILSSTARVKEGIPFSGYFSGGKIFLDAKSIVVRISWSNPHTVYINDT